MKVKVLIPIFFSILIGFLFGQIVFSQYDHNSLNVFEESYQEKIYFIKVATFTDKKLLTNYSENDYLIIWENNTYQIYGGITKNKKIANKIKEFYTTLGNNIYVEEKVVSDKSFLNLLEEYDKITLIANKDEDIINIEKIIMSNYKEIVLENGNDN